MDNQEIRNYIEQLREMESQLSSDDVIDKDIMSQFESILNNLNGDIMNEMTPNNGIVVKVKKLDPNAVIPTYSKVGDAGMDLTITNIKENTSFSISYGFGIAMEIPKGYVGLIFPRSSVRNQELILSNCVGVIDSGYRGEIQATFKKTNGLDSLSYNVGERGAQILILPYPQIYMTQVPELSNSDRGEGGFGSTGT